MKTRAVFLTLLTAAAFAVPATAALQPEDVPLRELVPAAATPAPGSFATLLADPREPTDFAIVLPTRHTTLEWINEDPFGF